MKKHRIAAFGEVLWDMLPGGAVLGGAPLNFAYRSLCLGNTPLLISSVGEDGEGDKALREMESLGIPLEGITRNSDFPTGTVQVDLNDDKDPSYTIFEEVAFDHIPYNGEIAERASGCDCFCFGTLAQRGPVSQSTLYRLLGSFTGKHVLFDINLRQNFYTEEVIRKSLKDTTILKLNGDELGFLTRLFGLTGGTLSECGGQLMERFRLSFCLITLGESGLVALSSAGKEAYSPAFSVELADPVGAGDSCAAGFIDALLNGKELTESVRFAAASGAVAASRPGGVHPFTRQDIERVMESEKYGPVHPEYE